MEKRKNNLTNENFLTFKESLKCVISGIGGFTAFLITIAAVKVLGFIFHTIPNVKLDAEDFILAMIGFVLVFLIKLFEQIGKAEKE